MQKSLYFRYKRQEHYFSLMWQDYRGRGTALDDITPDFVFQLVRDLKTGEVVGFCNEGGRLHEDYETIRSALRRHPITERFDVPALGLYDATVDRIIAEIHERYVVRGETFVPPPLDESQLPAWTREAEEQIRREMEGRPKRVGLYERRDRVPVRAGAAVREAEVDYRPEEEAP